MTLTFDISISEWGHGSPMLWASLLSINFQLTTPFRFRPRVKHGTDRETDGQTMAINPLCHYPMSGGHCLVCMTVSQSKKHWQFETWCKYS